MARLPRIVIPNQPLHIMHRGNNRQNIFISEEDLIRIKEDGMIKIDCKKIEIITDEHFKVKTGSSIFKIIKTGIGAFADKLDIIKTGYIG